MLGKWNDSQTRWKTDWHATVFDNRTDKVYKPVAHFTLVENFFVSFSLRSIVCNVFFLSLGLRNATREERKNILSSSPEDHLLHCCTSILDHTKYRDNAAASSASGHSAQTALWHYTSLAGECSRYVLEASALFRRSAEKEFSICRRGHEAILQRKNIIAHTVQCEYLFLHKVDIAIHP